MVNALSISADFDAEWPVIGAAARSFSAAGNRTRSVINGVMTLYVRNNLNQYTSVGSAAYAYDADGNLIAELL